jgi:putative cardiolipin synthase
LPAGAAKAPTFGLHAKTMVIDSRIAFIGTFNLDPRSENLNTEVGVVIYNDQVARAVEAAIANDMRPANSWNAATDNPDQYTSLAKRAKVRLWQWTPIKPLL